VLFIAALAAGSFWILHPFLSSLLWASVIVVATWPLMLRIKVWSGGRRWLAVTVMTVALLLVFVLPLSITIITIVERADEIVVWAKSFSVLTVPPPPKWLGKIPFAGHNLVERWTEIASLRPDQLSANLEPYAGKVVSWFIAKAGNVGVILLNFFLTVIIAALLYANGEKVSEGMCGLARRLAGLHGERTAVLAARAVRGVALGVVVTALVQSILGGVGLAVTGVPAAALLTGIMFLLCIAQIGPGLVLISSILWLYWSGQTFWGTVLIIWTIPVVIIDNLIRPFLIRKGADLPLVLIFAGVIGGLIAFGVVGLFIGPVVLAVTYTLLQSWVTGEDARAEKGNPEGGRRLAGE
jgi:predicted PurR-regulated permease PerM